MSPTRPARPCPQPGCPALIPCASHPRRPWHRALGTTTARGYGWGWQTLRLRILAEEPACRICAAPSSDVDHIIAKARGGSDARQNLRALCHPCHKHVTATMRSKELR